MSSQLIKPKLISFKLCPFVQRAAIVLSEKQITYEIEYIDLNNPPAWFLKVSPLRRVPVLEVGGEAIFESNVICEFLDEAYPRPLHPSDLLRKAINRGWNEFANNLMFETYSVCVAETESDFASKLERVWEQFDKLEQAVSDGPYFNGQSFSLVDTVYMPLFQRLDYLEKYRDMVYDSNRHPKITGWRKNISLRPSLRDSEVPDQEEIFREFVIGKNVYFSELMVGSK